MRWSRARSHRLATHLTTGARSIQLLLEVVKLLGVIRICRGGSDERRVFKTIILSH